jgi:hypothetical protein
MGNGYGGGGYGGRYGGGYGGGGYGGRYGGGYGGGYDGGGYGGMSGGTVRDSALSRLGAGRWAAARGQQYGY